ncbi:MAG: BTAD domain-containing putative transcriptional regulator, partial [Jatrophihabitantaceae bacterium]
MQVHDLGSLWVESDGLPLPLKGNRMTSALAVLVANLNEKVRSDVLIESVWGAELSSQAPAALDTLMWRLRRVLDPERSARASSTVLRTEEQGYRLTIEAECVDSWLFDATARTIAESKDPATVLELTAGALGLWRGRPYDDVVNDGWLFARRAYLTEQHLAVRQVRIGALLSTGQPEHAVAELVPLIAEHPFVEKLWTLRITGLYQSGRASAALEAFAEIQRMLDDELGLAPGPELQQLQDRVLRHDTTLSGPAAGVPARSTNSIPRHRTSLIGRDGEVDAITGLLATHRIVSVTGAVGCGKTRLATEVASRVQEDFADGVFFVDLSDLVDNNVVSARVQETLHIDGDATQTPAQAVAAFTAGRTVLIVLDNCEQVTSGVALLVAAIIDQNESSRVLLTSRRLVGIDGEIVFGLRPLEPPASAQAEDLNASPAVTLFIERAASHGLDVDLHSAQGELIATICTATDGLPLGLELAAARTRIFALHEVAASVATHPMA